MIVKRRSYLLLYRPSMDKRPLAAESWGGKDQLREPNRGPNLRLQSRQKEAQDIARDPDFAFYVSPVGQAFTLPPLLFGKLLTSTSRLNAALRDS